MKIPRISDAEWQVMKVIWKNDQVSAGCIIKSLEDKVDWKPNTIKSLISRLLNKNVIGFERSGKEYIYHALVPEEDCIRAEVDSFLERIFNGSLNSMVMHFAESKNLSQEDIDELKAILKKGGLK